MKDQVHFDEYAENYDAALNQGLSATGEGKDYFAAARIEWVARCMTDLSARSFREISHAPCNPLNACSGKVVLPFSRGRKPLIQRGIVILCVFVEMNLVLHACFQLPRKPGVLALAIATMNTSKGIAAK